MEETDSLSLPDSNACFPDASRPGRSTSSHVAATSPYGAFPAPSTPSAEKTHRYVCMVRHRVAGLSIGHGKKKKKKGKTIQCAVTSRFRILQKASHFTSFFCLLAPSRRRWRTRQKAHHGRQRVSLGDLRRSIECDWPGVCAHGVGETRLEAFPEPPAVAVLPQEKGCRERRRSRSPTPCGIKRAKLDPQRRRGARKRRRWRRRDAGEWQDDDVDDNRRFWPLARLSPRESSRRLWAHERRRGFFRSPGIPRGTAEPALAEGMRVRGELEWFGNGGGH